MQDHRPGRDPSPVDITAAVRRLPPDIVRRPKRQRAELELERRRRRAKAAKIARRGNR